MIGERLLNSDKFLLKAKEKFGDKYDYSDVEYSRMRDKVLIKCTTHKFSFFQSPMKHLESKSGGCKYCCNNLGKGGLDLKTFIEKSNYLHNFKYDYSKVDYKKSNLKIQIMCNRNGEFSQTPNSHLNGKGCPACSKNKRFTKDELIDIFSNVHNGKYLYDLSNYKNFKSKIRVKCNQHGWFEVSVYCHKKGNACVLCSNKSLGETKISEFLDGIGIEYVRQKSFDGCKFKNKMTFDFYLPKHNTIIEYDGIQHFKPIDWFGGIESFEIQKKKDEIKNIFCKDHGIKLLRISYQEDVEHKIIKNL